MFKAGRRAYRRFARVPCLLVAAFLPSVCRVAAQYPQLRDCSSLLPPQCSLAFNYDKDGSVTFDAYQEACTNHICSIPRLGGTPGNQTFCGPKLLDYPARMAADGPLPLGQAEDRYAACLFSNWAFTQRQGDCRYVQLWTCDDCAAAYKRWLCGTIFQRCANGDPNTRVRMCRDTCFDVVRKCPISSTGFNCPLNDLRDYVDGQHATLYQRFKLLHLRPADSD